MDTNTENSNTKNKMSEQGKNEVLWVGHPSFLLALPKLMFLILASIAIVAYKFYFSKLSTLFDYGSYIYYLYFIVACISFLLWGMQILKLKSTVYTLKEDRLMVKSGIIRRVTNELELFRVRDFQLDEPLLIRLFGLGNLVLMTSDKTSPVLSLVAIPDIVDVHSQMRQLVHSSWEKRGVREFDVG